MTAQILNLSSSRRRLKISGADAANFLHGQCTNDIVGLAVGVHCYAAFLTAKGKMRGDADIIRCGDESFLVSTHADLQPSLEKFIVAEDVAIEDVSAALEEWSVWGGDAPLGLARYDNRLGGTNVIGSTPSGTPIAPGEAEIMRIEAGIPLWSVDMDENTIPVEAGLAKWAIHYNKGCYIGQETIARIKTYGHVNRHLAQLTSQEPPDRGARIFNDQREVGYITSTTRSPKLGKAVSLGYLRREFAKPGSVVQVANQPAEVTKLCGE